jgi:hypothetical protein
MTNINKNLYIRVGIDYFKKINQPLASGDSLVKLAKWNKSTITFDEGEKILPTILKFDSFCIIPEHLNFKQIVGNSYNTYQPFEHNVIEGDYSKSLKFLEHIFGEQIQIGLDYLKLLLERPIQMLPILCLVSESRNTGKTTFLNYIKSIYGANMTINTNEDFRSQFNSDWATKLIIGVDEVLLDKIEDSERIKNLSTAKSYKAEAKGRDKVEGDFFGKFILCSNNEENFIKIDASEIRYWIRKVPILKDDNTNLLNELIKEIPAFLFFLIKRKYSTECQTRMWFTPNQIYTDALKKVKDNNKTTIEKEIGEIISEEIAKFELEEICFTNQDLLMFIKESGVRVNRGQITSLLQNKWGLKPNETPSSYLKYNYVFRNDGNETIQQERRKGRYYTFKKEIFNK